VKSPTTVEEAEEINPESSVVRPETAREEEAESAPVTFRLEVKVEEAAAMRPPEESMEKRVEEAMFWMRNGVPV
jgi:hypothetical protein